MSNIIEKDINETKQWLSEHLKGFLNCIFNVYENSYEIIKCSFQPYGLI